MSFQAYLDKLEEKTGKTPQQLLALADGRGRRRTRPSTTRRPRSPWCPASGRGHAMAFVHVLKNGATISDRHVGTTGTHRDESTELRLDGLAHR
jgi:hypothetical protein